MNIRFHNLIISILLSLPQIALAANMQLEIIPLQNRMVDDVIHIIRPLVVPGGTVTGMNNQLIVKTTPANLAEIKLTLNNIDHAPRRLMIIVKQNVDGSNHLREDSLTGKYTSDNVQINTSHDHSNEGLSVSAGDEKSNIRYRMLNNTSRSLMIKIHLKFRHWKVVQHLLVKVYLSQSIRLQLISLNKALS